MSNENTLLNMTKKPDLKNQDWHAADIVAAVRKTGNSLQRLSRTNNLADSTLGQALYRPYPKCERIIADYLQVKPQVIWPSRYNQDGTPKSGRGERSLGRHHSRLKAHSKNDTRPKKSRNVYQLNNEAVA
jgi:Ner family transcriptional regulator